MVEQLKPGDYIGLYIDNVLIYTGVLKDQGVMESGRKVYQVLLVKNIFQRNFPEIHFDSDIRPATWEQVQAEIKRLKIKLQKNLEQLEENVEQLCWRMVSRPAPFQVQSRLIGQVYFVGPTI